MFVDRHRAPRAPSGAPANATGGRAAAPRQGGPGGLGAAAATALLVCGTAGCEVTWGIQIEGVVREALQEPSGDADRGEVAVAYVDLAGGTRAGIAAAEVVHAASTMKIAVMIQVFRDVDAGRLALDTPVDVDATFASLADGSAYVLDAADDSDAALYEAVGQPRPVGDLVARMIARSSNLATNLLIELVEARRVQRTIEELGAEHMQVLRGVEDGKAYRAGLSNTATAADLATLLAAIARGEAASPGSCAVMLDILEGQQHDDLIPAGLPAGTRVLHKTGWITGILHDAAIVVPADAGAFVLVVLTRGFASRDAAAARIAAVARAVHTEHSRRHRGRAVPELLRRP